MQIEFIESRRKEQYSLPDEFIKKLPKKIALFTTITYMDSLENIKKQLENDDKEVLVLKTKHTKYKGQLLGCNIESWNGEDFDAFLYVGDGMFHPKALLLKNEKKVFVYNPLTEETKTLTVEDTDKWRKQEKSAYSVFLTSKKIGVLITTKFGQANLNKAKMLKKQFPEKKFYFLLDNTFDYSDIEDFNFIECFVNTACPRIAYEDFEKFEKPVININNLLKE